MRTFAFLLALFLTLQVTAQKSKNKTEVIQPVIAPEGIVYSLPRTGIKIIVKATQTLFAPGPYAAYADQLLGIRNAAVEKHSFWEIRKVSFEPFSTPDPEQIFKTNSLIMPLLQLSEEGCLVGFNTSSADSKATGPSTNSFPQKENDPGLTIQNAVVSANSSGRTSLEQRAVEAAALILKSRASRFEIVSGMLDEFHPDGKAYEESLNELRKTEKETMELFTGKSVTEEFTFVYHYIPGSQPVKGDVVFRFDENLGFLAKNDFSGKPVMIDVEKEESLAPVSQAPPTATPGLFYRQPGTGLVRLSKELTVIGTSRMTISQFGNVLPLPAEMLNGTYSVEFYPETGALRSILKTR